MSESATEQQASTETQAENQATDQGNPDEAALGDAGKKALDAMKARVKEAEKKASTLEAQLTQINQANESALEKAQREAKEAQEQAVKAGTDALRYRIAAESGITENVDLILTAPDEETMRKQATLWAARASATDSPAGPRPDLSQGGKDGATATDQDAATWLQTLTRR